MQQIQILNALWPLLAGDGKLLYATCSIFARENNQVVAEFLEQHDDAVQIGLFAPGMSEGQLLPNESTMDSSMHCCTKKPEWLCRSLCAICLWLCATSSFAEGIVINKAEARLTEEGYQLSADYDIQLSHTVETALKRGVTLYFVSELTINRSRW